MGTFRYFLLRNDLNGLLITPMSRGRALRILSKLIHLDVRDTPHFRGELTTLMRAYSDISNT
ncbi:hypothetical protein GCM10007278_13660 [Paenalcaligenes hominis]|nr:hypothetical protein GCM10007278_13660 [Paenalcaligenes hominis]